MNSTKEPSAGERPIQIVLSLREVLGAQDRGAAQTSLSFTSVLRFVW